ncbi:MAG: hypothetical protein JJT99_06945 [Rhodobacteraceae bacterium]|nr:hypothetical protein [Paracoccaceae bacterium]
MMWLQVLGRSATGDPALDIGIDSIVIVERQHGVFAVTNSRAYGGLVTYHVAPDGLSVRDSVLFHAGINRSAALTVVPHRIDGSFQLGVTTNLTSAIGYRLFNDGSIGARRWTDLDHIRADPANPVAQQILALQSSEVVPATGPAAWQADTIAYTHHDGGVLALGRYEPLLYSYASDADGNLTLARMLGLEDGLWIAAPTALTVFSAHGQTWAVLAAAGTNSLSVVKVGADGALMVVDHVTDTGATRFADVQAIAHAQIGDHALIVAAGSDFGVTLFTLLPDGRLVWMQSLEDTPETGLNSVSALETVVAGENLLVLVGSAKDAGLTTLKLPIAQLGLVASGKPDAPGTVMGSARDDLLIGKAAGDHLNGGEGHDILVAGPGHTIMTGGAGVDTFVMHPAMGLVQITDFERGVDRLDVSAWPMMRSPQQLQISPSADGALISYRDAVVKITAADLLPLELADLFPDGRFATPDRLHMLAHLSDLSGDLPPSEPPPPPVFTLTDRNGAGLGGIRIIARDKDSAEILGETITAADGSFSLDLAQPAKLEIDHSFALPGGTSFGNGTSTDILRLALGQKPAYLNGSEPTVSDYVAADINGDGRVSIRDALDALRIAMGLRAPPDAIILPEELAQSPANNGTALPVTQPLLEFGGNLVAVLRGDLGDDHLFAV